MSFEIYYSGKKGIYVSRENYKKGVMGDQYYFIYMGHFWKPAAIFAVKGWKLDEKLVSVMIR